MIKDGDFIGWFQFEQLIKLFNSKKYQLDRKTFCEILGVEVNNYNGYIKVLNLLKDSGIIEIFDGDYFNSPKNYFIDKKKLERLIRHTLNFSLVDNFIHKSTIFAETGVSP